jgi:hypothetical protein
MPAIARSEILVSNPHIRPETRQAFDRDGFVYLPGFLSPAELAELRARLDRYVRETVPGIAPAMFYEDKPAPTRSSSSYE